MDSAAKVCENIERTQIFELILMILILMIFFPPTPQVQVVFDNSSQLVTLVLRRSSR